MTINDPPEIAFDFETVFDALGFPTCIDRNEKNGYNRTEAKKNGVN